MSLTSRFEPGSNGVLIDPIRALLRRLTTINASDHTCRIVDAVGDLGATPALVTLAPRGAVRGFTLFVHGGRSNSVASGSRLQPPALRMFSFLMGVRRDGRGHGVAACQLRHRVRGHDEGDPVQDVEWALAEIAGRHGEVPFSLVGHSMDGRSALRTAGAANVRAAAALARWLPAGEPVVQLADSGAEVARCRRDRMTDPACSLEYAPQAPPLVGRLCRFEIGRSAHATLERFLAWRRLVREVVLASLGAWPWSARLHRAFALPDEPACRVEL